MGIKRKKKVCKECGEERYIYGRGLCNYCYAVDYKNRQREKQKNSPPKKRSYIKSVSDDNISFDSEGNRYTKKEVKIRVSEAKQKKIRKTKEENNNHIACEDCNRNDCVPVDCSHDISEAEAHNSSRIELAWDVDNITMRGRKCHIIHDNKPKEVREKIYEEKKNNG